MTTTNAKSPVEKELKRLETRLQALLQEHAQLTRENRSLRESQEQLATDRANLLHKNEQVKGRVEAMINRLRALEEA
ncbi:MAG TPA: TIGR02449 family protein [Gammaproteobacteria bacterium]|nr:TIGR02449 family protein [Gammaproteobacteria bacterium]